MSDRTKIAWADHTFNPWLGCHKVSQGCTHCYAQRLTTTRMRLDVFGADDGKRKKTSQQVWNKPLRWNKNAYTDFSRPARVFCASLADFFEDAKGPNQWRTQAWQVIRQTPRLDWLILTKRPENIQKMLPDNWTHNPWGCWPHVWLGVSIEDNHVAERSAILTTTPAKVHFISYEPAIGPFDKVPLDDVEWVICGGESGPGYRKMDWNWACEAWVRCEEKKIAFFFKQNSGPRSEMEPDLLGDIVRNFPEGWDRRSM